MYKKVALVFSCFIFIANIALAQNSDFCQAAKDSMKAQFKRGELGCFIIGKAPSAPVTEIKIFKTHYEKVSIKYATKDSIKQQKLDELQKKVALSGKTITDTGSQAKNFPAKKINPIDTSTEFKLCYNKAFQPKLDSMFKCDFFRKSDSIFKSYDKLGKGYKNVEFAGGAGALQKYMDKNVTLPKDAKPSDSDKVIRIYYSFFIDEKGKGSEPKLIKSNCKVCEDVVLAAIKQLPAFVPATEAGKPKKVKYILPYTKNYIKPKE